MRAVLFPGQGAQSKGMGGDLFQEFADITRIADTVLGYSIRDLCIDDPDNLLGQTQYTQPAVFVVNALSYMKSLQTEDQIPDYVAGHSLGEFSALLAAEAFDFETGLRLVKKRAESMAKAKNGGMAAVIGATQGDLEGLLADAGSSELAIANLNTLRQNILSGRREALDAVEETIQNAGHTFVQLPVSGAFHSPEMEDAKAEFAEYLRTVEFNWLRTPVISNAEALPYSQAKIKSLLTLQITSPVRWFDTIRYMQRNGVSRFDEIGPGSILKNMLAKIERELATEISEPA